MIDLKTILARNPSCLKSRTSFRGVLLDSYPSEKRTINILTILFECGIADRIKSMNDIDQAELQRLIAQTESDYGIGDQYAREAILIWAAAYDTVIAAEEPQPPQEPQIPPSPPKPKKQTTTKKPAENDQQTETIHLDMKDVTPVEGDKNDYIVEKKSNGHYYITKFCGFEEEEMTIPNMIDGKSITVIGEGAFRGCTAVKKIRISEGIAVLDKEAFKECSALEEVILPETLVGISGGVFWETDLKSVIIPHSVTVIGQAAFMGCENLTSVTLSDNITKIHRWMFAQCKKLKKIKLPKNLKEIDSEAFAYCYSLRELHIPVGTETIGEKIFKGTFGLDVYVPPSVTSIAKDAFDLTVGEGLSGVATIYCEAGSVALDHARKNKLKYAKATF